MQSNGRLLFVEDDPELQQLYLDIFEDLGFDVRVAGNGRRGILECQRDPPDVIILDMHLPDMDGVAVFHELLPFLVEIGISVVFITAVPHLIPTQVRTHSVVFCVVAKPFDLDTHLIPAVSGPLKVAS